MNILVTGGAGYIGSHTALQLIEAGHTPIVVDNLSNSSRESLTRVEQLTNTSISFYEIDMCELPDLAEIFSSHTFDAVIHFAGLKAVGESVEQPLHYYENNLVSTFNLLKLMDEHQVRTLVFSSSATVYGDPESLPIPETAPLRATNPYGQTKLMIEQILMDLSATGNNWNITSLRYFNPIGAHSSGRIGEDPSGIPNNLLPFISQTAVGKRQSVNIFGDDYDTPDGTGVRDYIHVVDLARAHIAALEAPAHPDQYIAYNVGTGQGVSVLQAIQAFGVASAREIPYTIAPRRPGDIASCYADVSLIQQQLGWQAKLSFEDACRDTWRWQSQNPDGYR